VASVERALLLSRTHYGESSLVALVLSPRHGRVRLLAKGAFRPTSRYAGVLDLFHTLELAWRAPAGDGLALLAEGDWLVRRAELPRFGAAYRAACAVLETARLVARDGENERTLFALCERALDALQDAARRGDEAAARLARVAFDLAALHNLGLAPALLHCAACGRRAPAATRVGETTVFDPASGGRLCQACATRARTDGAAGFARPPARLLEVAAGLLAGRAPAPDGDGAAARGRLLELERLVDRFTNHHLECERKSLAPTR
jgi:DNA repair protein RecO (recombination protein O)